MKWYQLHAFVLKFKAWIRREIVDDDPWDVETLFPSSEQEPVQPDTLEGKKPNHSPEAIFEKNLDAKSPVNQNRSHD